MKHEKWSWRELRERFPLLLDWIGNRSDDFEFSAYGQSKVAGEVRIALVARHEGEWHTLLVMNDWAMDCWKFHGGGVEPHEEPEEAAWRESLEEVGVMPRRLVELGSGLTGARRRKLIFYVSVVPYSVLRSHRARGVEGEHVATMPVSVFRERDFMTSEPYKGRGQKPLFPAHRELSELLLEYLEEVAEKAPTQALTA